MSHTDLAADRRAAGAVVAHHTQLAGELNRLTERLIIAVENADEAGAAAARADLLAWLRDDLIPHAAAEEQVLYPAAATRPEGRLLVDGMLDEHRTILELVTQLDAAGVSPVRAAAAARALLAVFMTHLAKENTLIVPLLVEADDVALAGLLDGMHAILGGHHEPHGAAADAADAGSTTAGSAAASPGAGADGCGGGGCGCGGDAEASGAGAAVEMLSIDPRIDVRDVPHEHRHARVLAALDAVPPGGALVLIAGHAPRPLLAQVDTRYDGQFATEWLQSGPAVWQIRLQRAGV